MTRGVLLLLIVLLVVSASQAMAEEDSTPQLFSGAVGLAGKYDSDFELTQEQSDDNEQEGDFIYELNAKLALNHTWNSAWHLECGLQGLANWPNHYRDNTWYVGNGNLFISYAFGANTISVLDNPRYYTVPGDREFDFFRNAATLAYKRVFSTRWEGRLGYENINNFYTENKFFNYYLNGGFVELRNPWTPLFSTYYMYDVLYYMGSYNAQQDDPLSSPTAGIRHTGEIGLDWLFARTNSLKAAYTFQLDNSSGQGLEQIGNFQGEEASLEVDAEFNFVKHKVLALYSHRFSERFTLSLYDEFIHKTFLERDSPLNANDSERTDLLFLSSVWFTARIYDQLYGKARYIFRMNDSTVNSEDFQDHIGSLGLEYRF